MITYMIMGYVIAILFPVPWVSQIIINAWSKGATLIGLSSSIANVVVSSTTVSTPVSTTTKTPTTTKN